MVPTVEYARRRMKIRQRLKPALQMTKGRTAVYSAVDEAMAYLGAQMAGLVRLNHLDQLLPEAALAEALEIPQWPSENTEQRFLKRATPKSLKGMDRLIQMILIEEELEATEGPIEVDGDVTGIPQRGRKREGVESGYCGGRTRPCYQQPRITVNGLPWWTDLRRGSDGCQDLFGRTLETAVKVAQRRPRRKVVMRVDGYFASQQNLGQVQEACRQQKNLAFLFPVHFRGRKNPRREELLEKSPGPYQRVSKTTQIKELGRVDPWVKSGRVARAVAVKRETVKVNNRKGSRRQWTAQYLIVTDTPEGTWSTQDVFRHYHQRQREEFSFKDGKQSLPMAKMPTQKLMANRMHVRMMSLAQLILQLFARKFLPHSGRYGPTCKTVREKVIAVGGKNQPSEHDPADADILRGALATILGSEDRVSTPCPSVP